MFAAHGPSNTHVVTGGVVLSVAVRKCVARVAVPSFDFSFQGPAAECPLHTSPRGLYS